MLEPSTLHRLRPVLTGLVALASLLAGWWLLAEPGFKVSLGLRGSLAALGVVLLLLRWAAHLPRVDGLRSAPVVRAVSSLVVVAWAAASIGVAGLNDAERVALRKEVHLWSHYHYFLGSKYFDELGYTGLYEQTVAVDREGKRKRVKARDIRDLQTYEKHRIDKLDIQRSPAFSDPRWEEFRRDVGFFLPRMNWHHILIDRGYNPTPTGNAIYATLSRVPLDEANIARVALVDAILLLAAFGAATWVFGPVRSIVAAAWLFLWFGNEHRVIGWPFQYDYVAAMIFMACAWRRGWHGLAGALLAYAAMVRVFPGVLLAGLVVWAAGWWWSRRSLPTAVARFGVAFVAVCLLLAVAGSFTGRGPGAWLEWSRNIALHSEHHKFGDKRIGLAHLFTFTEGDEGEWPYKKHRYAVWDAREPWWKAVVVLGGLLWAAVAFRGGRRGDDPLVHVMLALWLVFLAVVVSRYYWSVACVWFLVGGPKRDDASFDPLGAGLFAIVALYYAHAMVVENPYVRFVFANALILGWWLLVIGGLWRWSAPGAREQLESSASGPRDQLVGLDARTAPIGHTGGG